jgi:hypothetical protein
VTYQSIDIPSKYAVIFRCQHGKFIVEGTDDRHKDLWQRMKKGEQVTVSYYEVYTVDRHGNRALKRLKFGDATPAKNW